ncbi:uncharacterized protein LOC143587282 [Bidens hawaiensis]|uniref:uncharacterized protein LOC143587282 n=1 Tax=Bidens hawaiensis TaxID=980011 RepID=UPI00404A932E
MWFMSGFGGAVEMECREYWMYKSGRPSEIYMKGVYTFLKAAESNRKIVGSKMIWCPCVICKTLQRFESINDIEHHLLINGFMPNYTCWYKNGESRIDGATTSVNLNDDVYENNLNDDNLNNDNLHDENLDDMFKDLENDIGDDDKVKLQPLFEDAEKPLFNGSDNSKLEAVMKLFNMKAKTRWSNTSFTELLVGLYDMLPKGNELPISFYQAKKMMNPMGLKVERIHACENDCMLYRNEYENNHKCVHCGKSRYKRESKTDEYDNNVKKNGPPAKLLWYFPIIPRLKRLFSNEKEAKLLRWHSDERINDGKLRHVADSPQWRNINSKYPEFGNEVRNIRFGLSSDGINPFGHGNSQHSTWPVLLCIYNLPPWLCMKRKYIMMSLLIQGPAQPVITLIFICPL